MARPVTYTKRHRFTAALGAPLAGAVLVVGCSSGSEPVLGSSAPSSSVRPPTTTADTASTSVSRSPTTTLDPTTTTLGPTTTTEPDPTDDPQALLAAVNQAMATATGLLADTELSVSESAAAGQVLLAARATIGESVPGNSWLRGTMSISSPAFTGEIELDTREIDGVSYSRDALTGAWSVDDPGDRDGTDAAFEGALQLDGVTAEESDSGYVIRGTFAGGPAVEHVELVVDPRTLHITQVQVSSTPPRSEYSGLIPADGGELLETGRTSVRDYGIDVATAVPPPEGVSTVRWTSGTHPFELQIPADWTPASPAELAADMPDASAAFSNDDLVLVVVEEDLEEAGIGEASLTDYTRFFEANMTEPDVTVRDIRLAPTLQAGESAVMALSDSADFIRVEQFMFLHDGSTGLRATIVGPRLRMQEAEALIAFIFNSFLVTG